MMMVKIKNRYRLKSKDIKKIKYELQNSFNCDFFSDKSTVEIGEFDEIKIIFIDREPCFIIYDNHTIFTLHGLNKYKPKNNYVIVDMGAIKFVINGADIMAPGIVDADNKIKENDQVWICDEKNNKPLAVGIALMTGDQMIIKKKGKAVKIIHHVGDKMWNFVAKSL